MGGASAGELVPAQGRAEFRGEVSFEHGGGFASVRSAAGSWDLSDREGMEIEVLGDGRTYKMSLTTEPRYDSVVYRARFTPPAGEWSALRIPFARFAPTFRGRSVPEAPPLDPSRISTFGFLISDRQEGSFRLGIRNIKAY